VLFRSKWHVQMMQLIREWLDALHFWANAGSISICTVLNQEGNGKVPVYMRKEHQCI